MQGKAISRIPGDPADSHPFPSPRISAASGVLPGAALVRPARQLVEFLTQYHHKLRYVSVRYLLESLRLPGLFGPVPGIRNNA
jgi:hypothetical protein